MNALLERMKGDPIKDILEASYMNNQQQEDGEIRTVRNQGNGANTVQEALLTQQITVAVDKVIA